MLPCQLLAYDEQLEMHIELREVFVPGVTGRLRKRVKNPRKAVQTPTIGSTCSTEKCTARGVSPMLTTGDNPA